MPFLGLETDCIICIIAFVAEFADLLCQTLQTQKLKVRTEANHVRKIGLAYLRHPKNKFPS